MVVLSRKLFCLVTLISAVLLPAPATAAWDEIGPMTRSRFEASVVQYRDDLYVFNGFGQSLQVEPTIERFDAATRRWQVIDTTSINQGTAVTHNGVVRVGNEVWMIGGRVGHHPGAVTDAVWIYNLDTLTWKTGPSMPVPVAAGGAALVGNQIHWIGGLDAKAKCDVDVHFVLDVSEPTPTWQSITHVAAMPTPRNHFATVVLDDMIYAIGGQHGHGGCAGETRGDVPWVHAYDPALRQWEEKASLPAKQSHTEGSTLVYQGAIYLIGGEISGDTVYRYDPANDQWTDVLSLHEALLAPVAGIIDDQLIVASGGAPHYRSPTAVTRVTDMTPLRLSQAAAQATAQATSQTGDASPGAEDATSDDDEATPSGAAGLLVFEAEHFDLDALTPSHQWVVEAQADASNGAAIVTTPDAGELRRNAVNSPSVSYFAHFDAAGQWFVWIRGKGDTNANGEGGSDSVHAGFDGSLAASADKIDHFPPQWTWSNSTRDGQRASITLAEKGIHAFNLWMREDGLAIDKIVLSQDPTYQPQGDGPEPDDGSSADNSVPPVVDDDTDATVDDVAVSVPSDTASAQSEALVIEAEAANTLVQTAQIQWVETQRTGASGSAMVTTPDRRAIRQDKDNSPEMRYSVEFPVAGEYHVWVRGWGDTANGGGRSDSVHIGINGSLGSAQAIEHFPEGWHWSRELRGGGTATITVPSAGAQTVNIWMREDGFIVDQVVLVQDAAWRPPANNAAIAAAVSEENSPLPHPGSDADENTQPDTAGAELIQIELEEYFTQAEASGKSWMLTQQAGFSGFGALLAGPETRSIFRDQVGSPELQYLVDFAEAGTYTVWVRGWGDTVNGEGRNDSLHVGINGTLGSAQALQNFPSGWSWSNERRAGGLATLTVPSPGTHIINVWMREDGLIVDKLALSLDPDWVPAD